LPSARPDDVAREIEHVTGTPAERVLRLSAKTGAGVEEVLEHVVTDLPAPGGRPDAPLRALIFDSKFDPYRGVVALVRVVDGSVRMGGAIRFLSTGKIYEVAEVGRLRLGLEPREVLEAGQVGYIVAGVKAVADARVGDTIADGRAEGLEPLPGFREVQSMVFSGLYPIDSERYEALKDALGKLVLNDAALIYQPETSVALGFGFRCGFLG